MDEGQQRGIGLGRCRRLADRRRALPGVRRVGGGDSPGQIRGDEDFWTPEPDLTDQVRPQLVHATATVDGVPCRHDARRVDGKSRLAKRKLPRHFGRAAAGTNHRLVKPSGNRNVVAKRDFNVATANDVDHSQVSIVGGKPGDHFERYVVRIGEQPEQGGVRTARPLQLPGLSAVAAGQDRAQLANGPATPVVEELNGPQPDGRRRRERLPGATAIGRMKDACAWRPRDPTLRPMHHQGGKIEVRRGHRQRARRRSPGSAAVDARTHQSAVADEPAAGRWRQPQRTVAPQHELLGRGRLDFTATDDGRRSIATRQRAAVQVQKIAGQPIGGHSARYGPPMRSGVVRHKYARRIHRRGAGDGPTMSSVQKPQPPNGRQQELWLLGPCLSAVASCQQHAGARMCQRLNDAAGRPANLFVVKANGRQRAVDAGGLQPPLSSAVVGVPNHAPVADRPTVVRIDEANVIEPGIAERAVRGGGQAAQKYQRKCRIHGTIVLREPQPLIAFTSPPVKSEQKQARSACRSQGVQN